MYIDNYVHHLYIMFNVSFDIVAINYSFQYQILHLQIPYSNIFCLNMDMNGKFFNKNILH